MDFHVIDVFSATACEGNPVLVVEPGTDMLDTARMQAFAAWNGMPETVYLGIPSSVERAGDAVYTARIFSPLSELGFAGHPTLGAVHAAIQTGLVQPYWTDLQDGQVEAALLQRCMPGDVAVRARKMPGGGHIAFVKTPVSAQLQQLDTSESGAVARSIGSSCASPAYRVSTGASWLVVRLDDAEELASLTPDMAAIVLLSKAHGVSGVTVYAPLIGDPMAHLEVRSFGPVIGVPEDAVCGGGNACVGVLEHHLCPAAPQTYSTRQGRFVGRRGLVSIQGPVNERHFWIGGATRTVMRGKASI